MAEPRIAIITMVRRSEFPAAASSLATISANLGPNRRHFVLVNDDRDEAFELNLAEREDTELLAPGVNLGVARGRNALIEAALAWGATYIASVDDDLLLPSDYLDRMLLHIQSLESQGANPGVVGPAIVDFHGYADACMTPTEKRNAEIGRLDGFCSTEELAERIRSTWLVIPSEVIYHLGVRHWQNHYLTVGGLPADQIRTLIADLVDDFDSSSTTDQSPTELHRDPKVLRSVARRDAGPVRVDGIPGGACIFSPRVVREIGLMDLAFSPFGYEDADSSIRATTRGFRNYLLPYVVVLHDLDSRGKTRDIGSLLFVQGRSRASDLRSRSNGLGRRLGSWYLL